MSAPHTPLIAEPLDVARSVEERGPFIILSVIDRSTSTKRRTSAKTHFSAQETDHINPPDHSTETSTQTAVINIAANLGDHNLDDKWWAWVTYSLTCMGRHPL